jgi:hypothetical protein
VVVEDFRCPGSTAGYGYTGLTSNAGLKYSTDQLVCASRERGELEPQDLLIRRPLVDHALIIRNGNVVDGSGGDSYRADIGISGTKIDEIGRVRGTGKREFDATGYTVTPGFIDGHTHMDAQVF